MTGNPWPVYLYGIHDPGPWRERLHRAGLTGWVVFEETIGADPEDTSGRGSTYQAWADAGFGVIVVLNHGRYPNGTLPPSSRYEAFARRCARFVAASPGAHLWIIGNEPNHPQQQPGACIELSDGRCEAVEWITPERYADCFRRCREWIRNQPGHEDDWVIPAAVAPFTAVLRYPGNPTGDWVVYFHDLLAALGTDLDGIALHVVSQSPDPRSLSAEIRCPPPYEVRRAGFRVYQDFIEAIPPHLRHLPIFITEASMGDQGGKPIPWPDADTGWIYEAYAEIHRWNADPAHPPIRCLVLYRWQRVDPWFMEGKERLLDDLDRALAARFRWDVGLSRFPRAILRQETRLRHHPGGEAFGNPAPKGAAGVVIARTEDNGWCAWLQPETGRQGWVPRDALALQGDLQDVPLHPSGPVSLSMRRPASLRLFPSSQASAFMELPEGQRGVAEMITADRGWWRVRFGEHAGWVRAIDVRVEGDPWAVPIVPRRWADEDLERLNLSLQWMEPLLPRRRHAPWPRRPPELIRWLILHPLDIPGDLRPEALAAFLVEQGDRPGFPYHFYVMADGQVFWTLPLEAMTDHAGGYGRVSLGIALAGWGKDQPPLSPQIDCVARLCAWLLTRLRLGPSQIQTVRELFPLGDRFGEHSEAPPDHDRLDRLSSLSAGIRERVRRILEEVRMPVPGLPEPVWRDLVGSLPTRPGSSFPLRPLGVIQYVVLHQTGTDGEVTPAQIAAFQVERLGLPGAGYHFLVGADGTLYRIQPLTAAVSHVRAHNATTVSIGLIGDFSQRPPGEPQLTAAAWLTAYLLEHLGLGIEAVKGHEELDAVSCPGGWRTGVAWRGMLIAQIQAILRLYGAA
ncbi:N-acetylmuramoyl-L-alanine amidase [Thermoflexus sp.]|uniref:peptidoglycan recognition protein family protein n=1 Tax=Thermoflexus sp. TaxID=1969742 RepID=UPI0035E40ACC